MDIFTIQIGDTKHRSVINFYLGLNIRMMQEGITPRHVQYHHLSEREIRIHPMNNRYTETSRTTRWSITLRCGSIVKLSTKTLP